MMTRNARGTSSVRFLGSVNIVYVSSVRASKARLLRHYYQTIPFTTALCVAGTYNMIHYENDCTMDRSRMHRTG
jgi:hypothetical protein